MAFYTAQQRLARRSFLLKKVWQLAALMAGHIPRGSEAIVPDYLSWRRRELEPHVQNLEADILDAFAFVLENPTAGLRSSALRWLAAAFDRWQESGFAEFLNLSNALDFESNVGKLRARDVLDIPPYAELLVQPGVDLAFRHPEYMLARDLECLHDLYRDAEQLVSSRRSEGDRAWRMSSSENAQTLGRTAILTCFNLIESFISGLARAHAMLSPSLDPAIQARLLSNQDALRRRIVAVPRQILGREPGLDINKPPLSTLFGPIKQLRDSIVHCEPGSQLSSHGFVKERLFHSISMSLVDETVETTEAVIRLVWQEVYTTPGPRWLGIRDESGRYRRQNLALTLRTGTEPGSTTPPHTAT
jgi:hypothetical protein